MRNKDADVCSEKDESRVRSLLYIKSLDFNARRGMPLPTANSGYTLLR